MKHYIKQQVDVYCQGYSKLIIDQEGRHGISQVGGDLPGTDPLIVINIVQILLNVETFKLENVLFYYWLSIF